MIGSGAYGTVFKARNSQTGELVAVKKFRETGARARVRARARARTVRCQRRRPVLASLQRRHALRFSIKVPTSPGALCPLFWALTACPHATSVPAPTCAPHMQRTAVRCSHAAATQSWPPTHPQHPPPQTRTRPCARRRYGRSRCCACCAATPSWSSRRPSAASASWCARAAAGAHSLAPRSGRGAAAWLPQQHPQHRPDPPPAAAAARCAVPRV